MGQTTSKTKKNKTSEILSYSSKFEGQSESYESIQDVNFEQDTKYNILLNEEIYSIDKDVQVRPLRKARRRLAKRQSPVSPFEVKEGEAEDQSEGQSGEGVSPTEAPNPLPLPADDEAPNPSPLPADDEAPNPSPQPGDDEAPFGACPQPSLGSPPLPAIEWPNDETSLSQEKLNYDSEPEEDKHEENGKETDYSEDEEKFRKQMSILVNTSKTSEKLPEDTSNIAACEEVSVKINAAVQTISDEVVEVKNEECVQERDFETVAEKCQSVTSYAAEAEDETSKWVAWEWATKKAMAARARAKARAKARARTFQTLRSKSRSRSRSRAHGQAVAKAREEATVFEKSQVKKKPQMQAQREKQARAEAKKIDKVNQRKMNEEELIKLITERVKSICADDSKKLITRTHKLISMKSQSSFKSHREAKMDPSKSTMKVLAKVGPEGEAGRTKNEIVKRSRELASVRARKAVKPVPLRAENLPTSKARVAKAREEAMRQNRAAATVPKPKADGRAIAKVQAAILAAADKVMKDKNQSKNPGRRNSITLMMVLSELKSEIEKQLLEKAQEEEKTKAKMRAAARENVVLQTKLHILRNLIQSQKLKTR